MATIVEMTAQIISAQASSTPMTTEELLANIQKIHASLKGLETGESTLAVDETKPVLSYKQSFKKNEIICLVCGKGGFKTLTRHLSSAHDIKPKEYKQQFGIPAKQALSAKSLTEQRKKIATENNLAGNLEKARAVRAANVAGKAKTTKKAPVPAVKKKAPVPAKVTKK